MNFKLSLFVAVGCFLFFYIINTKFFNHNPYDYDDYYDNKIIDGDEYNDSNQKESKYKLIDYSNTTLSRNEDTNSITFKVCEVEEKELDNTIKEFKIDNFIKYEIESKQKKEHLNHFRDYDITEKRNEKEKELNTIFQNTKALKSSFNNNDHTYKEMGYNSFVYGAWRAYNTHNHLVIRPDNIWMAIMTQFSFYVNKNSENLRDKFIDFKGKKEIKVRTPYPILETPFDQLILEISDQIKLNIKDPSIRDWVIPSFSTTNESDKIIFASVLLSTMQKYFDYIIESLCGLSKVTLEGELQDWIDLKEKVQRLIEFDNKENEMSKWVDYLLPVMDKLIESASGKPDTKWWNQIVDFEMQSGGSILSGWLSIFCLFDKDGDFNDNAHYFYNDRKSNTYPSIYSDSIPNGYVSTPIKLIDFDGTEYKSNLYGGHISIKVEDNTKIIPSLDWIVIINSNNS